MNDLHSSQPTTQKFPFFLYQRKLAKITVMLLKQGKWNKSDSETSFIISIADVS